jgi:hypothetical protein
MSVVQISRIQQRRGKKNSDFGFPQLASGELGWAIDTQELYIGNGAVSEGAPYVGNSKILTEHDDILNFVALYEYEKGNHSLITGPSEGQPINRSLQDRLDDFVSIRSFGANGDGITDDTMAFQRAIDQLFLNDSTKRIVSSRVVLYIDPGEYLISSELKIPPYAHLVGAGIDSTIITQTANYPIFKMVANDPNADGTYLEFGNMNSAPERPRYILISALTLKTNTPNRLVYLDNTDSTLFDKVKFLGNYISLTTDPNTNHIAVESRGTSFVLRSFNVLFNFCIFNNIGTGFYSESDHDNINFDHCTFNVLYDAINIGGLIPGDTQSAGATNTSITHCYFDNIKRYGIYIRNGYGNTSSNNKFMAVGNNGAAYSAPEYANIKFDSDNNQSINDYFHRNTELRDHIVSPYRPFVPAIQTSSLIYNNNNFHKNLEYAATGTPKIFLRLPLFDSGTYVIDYVIKKEEKETNAAPPVKIPGTTAIRTGTMTVIVDAINALSTITDNYQYVGHESVENVIFNSEVHNYPDGDTVPITLPLNTLVINLENPFNNGLGTMNCVYRMMTK